MNRYQKELNKTKEKEYYDVSPSQKLIFEITSQNNYNEKDKVLLKKGVCIQDMRNMIMDKSLLDAKDNLEQVKQKTLGLRMQAEYASFVILKILVVVQ